MTGVRHLADRRQPDRHALRARRRVAAGRSSTFPRCCRARSGCASRPRSTRPGAPRSTPSASAPSSATDLGPGPWGPDASPTWVGPVKVMAVSRARIAHPDAPLDEQVRAAVHALHERGALRAEAVDQLTPAVSNWRPFHPSAAVVVVVEPDRAHATRELLGSRGAAGRRDRSWVTAITVDDHEPEQLGSVGRRPGRALHGDNVEEDVARAVTDWVERQASAPWAIITGSTAWGREGRVARSRRGSAPASPATQSTSRSPKAGSSRGSRRSVVNSWPRSARLVRPRWRRCAPA